MSADTPKPSADGNQPPKPKLKLKLKQKSGSKSGGKSLSLKKGGTSSKMNAPSVTKPPLPLVEQDTSPIPAIETPVSSPSELPPMAPGLPPAPPSLGAEVPPVPPAATIDDSVPESGDADDSAAPELSVPSVELPPAPPSLDLPPAPPSLGAEVPPVPPAATTDDSVPESGDADDSAAPELSVPNVELPPAPPSLDSPPVPPSPGLEVPLAPPAPASVEAVAESEDTEGESAPELSAVSETPGAESPPAPPSLDSPPVPPSPGLEVPLAPPAPASVEAVAESEDTEGESAPELSAVSETPGAESPPAPPSLDSPPVPLSPGLEVPSAPPAPASEEEVAKTAGTDDELSAEAPVAEEVASEEVLPAPSTIDPEASESDNKDEETSSGSSNDSDHTFSELSRLKAKVILLNSKIGSIEDLSSRVTELTVKVSDFENTLSKSEDSITETAVQGIVEKNLTALNETKPRGSELEKLNELEEGLKSISLTTAEGLEKINNEVEELKSSLFDTISKGEENKKSILSIIDKIDAFENEEPSPLEGLSKGTDELRAMFAELEEKLTKVTDEQSTITAKVLEFEERAEDVPPPPPPAQPENPNDSLAEEADKLSEKFDHLWDKFEKFSKLQAPITETSGSDSSELIQEELEKLKDLIADETEARQENKKIIISLMDEVHGLKNALEERHNNELITKAESAENTKDIILEENQSNELNLPDPSSLEIENILDEPISNEENKLVVQRNILISRINIFA